MRNRIDFFKVAVKNLKTSGTIAPSSRFLAKKMVKNIDFSTSKVLVELGPGNGVITNYILKKISKDTQLICFEINEEFYNHLKKIEHPQLTVLKASAEDIKNELKKLGHSKACHIISTLPLSILSKVISHSIIRTSLNSLKQNGTFIQCQYSLAQYKYLKTIFKDSVSLDFELLNIPPSFVYRCKKLN